MWRERRLTFLMTTGVAAPLLLFAGFAALTYDSALDGARAMTRDRVALLREQLTQLIRFEEKVLHLADSLLEARGGDATHPFLKDLVSEHQGRFPLAAVDSSGRVFAISGEDDVPPASVADRPYFRQAMATGQVVIGTPLVTRITRLGTVPLAVPRRNGDGIFVVGLRLDYLEGLFADATGEAAGEAFIALVRDDGVLLAQHPHAEGAVRLPPDAPLLRQAARATNGTFEATSLGTGEPMVASFARLGDYPVHVTFAVTRAGALAPWRRGLATGGSVAVLASLLLGGLAHGARRQARLGRRTEQRLAAEVQARTREAERRAAEAEEASADARRALVAADRADRAKIHFLAAISHDLRQPLQGLRLYLDFADNRGGAVAAQALGAQARQSLEQMESLLASTLDLSMLDTGALDAQVRDVALGPVLMDLYQDFHGAAAKKGLDLVIVPTSLSVRSDPVLLRRILTNLVSNAIRYTLQGRVVVGVRRGGGLRVLVADSGVGLEPEAVDRILGDEPSPDRHGGSSQGLGLGLSIVRRMAGLLGHDLSVRSVPGRGSCFGVLLGPGACPVEAGPGVAPAAQPVTLGADTPAEPSAVRS